MLDAHSFGWFCHMVAYIQYKRSCTFEPATMKLLINELKKKLKKFEPEKQNEPHDEKTCFLHIHVQKQRLRSAVWLPQAAYQPFSFRYIDSTIPLLSKSGI